MPRKKMIKKYAKGRRLEYGFRDWLRLLGFEVFRMASSKPIDLIALMPTPFNPPIRVANGLTYEPLERGDYLVECKTRTINWKEQRKKQELAMRLQMMLIVAYPRRAYVFGGTVDKPINYITDWGLERVRKGKEGC